MSWQSYVDDHLIGTGHVVQGAICGVDGAIWAVSAGFNVRPRASPGKRQITMSWQSYVDDHLIGTGHVVQGAICGVDGAIWAVSAGFNVRPRASHGPVPSLFFSR